MQITVNADWLYDVLIEHEIRYRQSFKAMIDAWKELTVKYQKEYQDFVDGKLNYPPSSPYRPEDRSNDYDLYIAMLEDNIPTTVDLNEEEYNCLVLDKWGWMTTHIHSLGSIVANDITASSISASTLSSLNFAKASYDK